MRVSAPRWVAAGLLLVAAGAAGACEAAAGQVASLGGGGVSGAGADSGDQRAAAGAMAECLAGEGVEAVAAELGDGAGQLSVLPGESEPWQVCWADGCTFGGAGGLSGPALEQVEDRFSQMAGSRPASPPPEPGLARSVLVGVRDVTDLWSGCERQTGYRRPEFQDDPARELADKQAVAASGVRWAQCARANGFPSTRDPGPVAADGWATAPTVVLPADITEDQLSALLVACPQFDVASRWKADEALLADPDMPDDEYWALAGIEPAIGFDVPCLGGEAQECPEGVWEQYATRFQVLEQTQNNYLREFNRAQRL